MKAIAIDRKRFTLALLRGTSGRAVPMKVYEIAVGGVGYRTKPGVYFIESKERNPDWLIPDSEWAVKAGLKPGTLVPGGDPLNPLIARWIGLDRKQGIGIHGTASLDSLGTAASHGCVRMAPGDVKELYEEIPHPPDDEHPDGEITPVYID